MSRPLSGRGRFETVADDADRFHLRQSSLDETTLRGYMAVAAGLALMLALAGLDVLHRPSVAWPVVVALPILALWVLRHSNDLVVDRALGRLVLRCRRAAFREECLSIALPEVDAVHIRAQSPAASVSIAMRDGTSACLAREVPAGVAERIARRVASMAGVAVETIPGAAGQIHRDRGEIGTYPVRTPAPPACPLPRELPAASVVEVLEDGGTVRVAYPTRAIASGVAVGLVGLVVLALGGFFGVFGIAVVASAGVSLGWLLTVALAFSLVAIGVTTGVAALGLLWGGEVVEAGPQGLAVHTHVHGLRIGSWRRPWAKVRALRAEDGVRVVTDLSPTTFASTLAPAESLWLLERLEAVRRRSTADLGPPCQGRCP